MNQSALERCLRKLISQGKRHDGLITYTMILDVLDKEAIEVSVEDVDSIYKRLRLAGIEIVDGLPDSNVLPTSRPQQWCLSVKTRRPARVGQRRRRYRRKYVDEDPFWYELALATCPEKALDALVSKAECGTLSKSDLINVAEQYELSTVETRQLVEYLILRTEQLDLDLLGFYKMIVARDEQGETEVATPRKYPFACSYCVAFDCDRLGWECADRLYDESA
ncbi:MAG: RNA polymerase sigma factor region1.1 domain-containing protein [Candidatus Fermentithermobacillus carboniphilus]|uniref:RNA polymerase sigma factor region1.1 domain-containing protein n=1 Tax=Candidatus Fermentithermobacillus carboniphilus TaxID=3085328 RepID=A0AAT9L9S3_9FIRM|nr:MAG: RNA polymerase sigma factor region1.1 domain-containing protein [Candidatus Fermentithermobacillus carboniphilus]